MSSPLIGYADPYQRNDDVMVTWGHEVYTLNRAGEVSTDGFQVHGYMRELDEEDDAAAATARVLAKLVGIQMAKGTRQAIADALDVSVEQVGAAIERKARAS